MKMIREITCLSTLSFRGIEAKHQNINVIKIKVEKSNNTEWSQTLPFRDSLFFEQPFSFPTYFPPPPLNFG